MARLGWLTPAALRSGRQVVASNPKIARLLVEATTNADPPPRSIPDDAASPASVGEDQQGHVCAGNAVIPMDQGVDQDFPDRRFRELPTVDPPGSVQTSER
jgi:hypothetical protein